jgi:hypothetical protein
VLPLSVAIALVSYSTAYWGILALRGYSAVVGFSTDASGANKYAGASIGFLDVILPSRLSKLQGLIAAGPAQPTGSSAGTTTIPQPGGSTVSGAAESAGANAAAGLFGL